jgi:acetoacetyl-CoA synthetase
MTNAPLWRPSPGRVAAPTGCRAPGSSPTRGSTSPRTCCATPTIGSPWCSGEGGSRETWTRAELYDEVSRLVQVFRECRASGRATASPPTCPTCRRPSWACWRGRRSATWSSCSPDFGVQGVVDRFGQIEPTVLCARTATLRRRARRAPKVAEVWPGCPRSNASSSCRYRAARGVPPYRGLRRGPNSGRASPARTASSSRSLSTTRCTSCIRRARPACRSASCTGGRHAAAAPEGTPAALRCPPGRPRLLLHDLRLDDVELAGVGARLGGDALLYDGSPFHPDGNRAVRLRRCDGVTLFGTSAKFIDAVHKAGLRPIETTTSDSCARSPRRARRWRPRASTSSTPASSRRRAPGVDLRRHRHRELLRRRGDPTLPVWRGEIQRPAWAWPSRSSTTRRAVGAGAAQGRAGVHGAVPLDAARLLERSRRPQVPRRRTSSASRACGATATGRS